MSSQYIPWAAGSHKGLCRDENQDAYKVRPDLGLWVVCDGLGGHAGGKIAATTAAETVVRRVSEGMPIKDAVLDAHFRVGLIPSQYSEYAAARPASTIAALHALPGGYTLVWVGDTKGYVWDGLRVKPLTRDHTWVQQLADEGRLTPEEVAAHPFRGVLTGALGLGNGVPEIGLEAACWNPFGMSVILATDGLDCVGGEDALSRTLADASDQDKAVQLLIRAALNAGGPDNVTVAVIGWPMS